MESIQSTHICLFDIYKVDPEKWGVVFDTLEIHPAAFPLRSGT